jgi:hypothetical protein
MLQLFLVKRYASIVLVKRFEREREREREESDLYSVSMLCFFVKEGKYFPVIKL